MLYTSYAIVEMGLKYPYQQSVFFLFKLINLWNFRLRSFKTNSSKAIVEIPKRKFETIFADKMKRGTWDVPRGTGHFLVSIKVLEIKKDFNIFRPKSKK
ncbi:MAG: hypothetical protein ACOC5T_04875 [Elusimicrobiota bacterium]